MQPLNRTKLCLYRLYLHPNAARCVAGLQKDQRRCLSMKLTKAGAARILCVSDRSSSEEVRSKFRALAFQHHPDITGGSSERFQEVYEAYRVLSGKGAGADERSMPMKSAEEVAVERLGKAVEEGDVEGGLEIWAYLVSAEGFVLEYFSVFPTVMRLVAMSENPRHGFRVIAEAEEKGYLPGEAYARWYVYGLGIEVECKIYKCGVQLE